MTTPMTVRKMKKITLLLTKKEAIILRDLLVSGSPLEDQKRSVLARISNVLDRLTGVQ